MGIHQAHGKYIQLIAGDDILYEQAIAEKYQFAERNGFNLVACRIEPFGANQFKVDVVKKHSEKCFEILQSDWKKQYDNIIKFNIGAGPAPSFFSRCYFKEIGGFDVRYPMLEDWPFLFHYIVNGNKVEFLDKPLQGYRVSDVSITGAQSGVFLKSLGSFFFRELLWELVKSRRYKEAVDGIFKYFPQLFGKSA